MTAFVLGSIWLLFDRMFLGLRVTAVCAVMLLTAMPLLAAPQDEAALVKAAQPQLDALFDPASETANKVQAVKDLQTILSKMNVLVESSPELKKRVDSDDDPPSEFLMLRRSLIEALPEQARKLGIKLDEAGGDQPDKPATTDTAPSASGGSCPAIPMPNPYDVANKDTPALVKAVRDAYDKLNSILDEPVKTLQDRLSQDSRRNQALRDLVITQANLIWSYAGGPPKDEWGALLDARAKFQRDLNAIRSNDAKIMPLMQRLRMLHAQFNNQKREMSHNGKATPSFFQLDAEARKVIAQIEALQGDSVKTYQEFLKVIAPTETAAKALFRKQFENGLENINDHLQREGHTGPPFQLFKPETGHERFLLDQALGKWVTEKLLIIGARTRSGGWTDFTTFTDFDYSTRGPAKCTPPPPDDKDSADKDTPNESTEDIGDLFDDVSPAEQDKTACNSGGIVGTLNCKVVEPMRSGAEEF